MYQARTETLKTTPMTICARGARAALEAARTVTRDTTHRRSATGTHEQRIETWAQRATAANGFGDT